VPDVSFALSTEIAERAEITEGRGWRETTLISERKHRAPKATHPRPFRRTSAALSRGAMR
jgi:hypothetical protein